MNEWISVNDRLPENTDDVLVTDGKDFAHAFFDGVQWECAVQKENEVSK